MINKENADKLKHDYINALVVAQLITQQLQKQIPQSNTLSEEEKNSFQKYLTTLADAIKRMNDLNDQLYRSIL